MADIVNIHEMAVLSMSSKEKDCYKWFKKCITALLVLIIGSFALFWVIDPYFHFHKPVSFISYRLYDERYINDGISRYFDYDTIITGTSMAQNFKTSDANRLMGVNSVKETFSGATYGEISGNLDRALKRRDGIKNIIWAMDLNSFVHDKDLMAYESYPTYLYDDNIWNDAQYVFNKSIWYHGVLTNLVMTFKGESSTTFDEYSSWHRPAGLENISLTYKRSDEKKEMLEGLSDEEKELLTGNIEQNFVELVNKYPDIMFYIFYTPYSICWWDSLNQDGTMKAQLEAELMTTEMLLKCPNIKLFNFNDKYEIITDLSNYSDKEHYDGGVSAKMLEWIAAGDGLVTKDNYLELLQKEKDYYLNYDYDSIYQ